MIKVFSTTDLSFTSNGDIVVKPLKAKVHKEDNGDFYLDLETDLSYIDYIVPNNIVVANTPQGDQAFRVGDVEKTRKKITCRCYHVFYDSKNYLIEDSYVVDKNCNDALSHLNSATSDTSPFTTYSNIGNINSFRCVRKSLFEAINTVLERWGGHLVRDNFDIKIKSSIGQDNGVTIEYKKNLQDIQASYNWQNVVTKLLPVGKDGILLNALDSSKSLYVYSETQYDIPYTKTISFTQDTIIEDDYKDSHGNLNETAYKQALIDDLSVQAQDYVSANCIPQVNYTLKANIEKITDIGDTVEVIDKRLGIDLMTNIISFDYDCILKKYTEVEFGNFTQSLKSLISNITSSASNAIQNNYDSLQLILSQELQVAQDRIFNALQSSYVIYNGDNIQIVDTLPKENASNVIMINNNGIAFSNNGINGQFTPVWTIDNVLNMQAIDIINLNANLIKGGTLKLGSNLNQNGQVHVFDQSNTLIAKLNNNGLTMYGIDGSCIVINNQVGFVGYDKNNSPIYWVANDEFHIKKSVIEEEIILCNKMKFIPITLYDGSNNITNDGIALVSVSGGGN